MNKYALGTVLGTALLSFLAKKNTKGSNVKIKPVCRIEARIECRVDITLILTEPFHPRYKNLVALTEKVWGNLVVTKVEETQSSEQQSSEQQSSEQQSVKQHLVGEFPHIHIPEKTVKNIKYGGQIY